MQNWLLFNGTIWPEDILRQNNWSDETLRAPHACRVRENIVKLPKHENSNALFVDFECTDYRIKSTSTLDSVSRRDTSRHDNLFKCTLDDLYGYNVVEKREAEFDKALNDLKKVESVIYKITDRDGSPINATLNQPVKTEITHIYTGSLKGRHGLYVKVDASCEMRSATFEDGLTLYVSGNEVEPITENKKRVALTDDIDALCLSIQKRQSELTRLVKQLKG